MMMQLNVVIRDRGCCQSVKPPKNRKKKKSMSDCFSWNHAITHATIHTFWHSWWSCSYFSFNFFSSVSFLCFNCWYLDWFCSSSFMVFVVVIVEDIFLLFFISTLSCLYRPVSQNCNNFSILICFKLENSIVSIVNSFVLLFVFVLCNWSA